VALAESSRAPRRWCDRDLARYRGESGRLSAAEQPKVRISCGPFARSVLLFLRVFVQSKWFTPLFIGCGHAYNCWIIANPNARADWKGERSKTSFQSL